jgi:transcriptional regulator GlxA family with amidase domain
VFDVANRWRGNRGAAPAYAIRTASLGGRLVRTSFAAETGLRPGRYVDRARLEAARRRLEDTVGGIEEAARACGYGTPEAMRRAFVKALGVSPAEYRRRFRPTAGAQPGGSR